MLAPSPWSSSSSSAVRAAAAPLPSLSCCGLPAVGTAIQRTTSSATAAAAAASLTGGAVPTNPPVGHARALPATAVAPSPPVLLSGLHNRSATALLPRQPQHHFRLAEAAEAHATASAAGDAPTEAVGEATGVAGENDAAAGITAPCATSRNVRELQPGKTTRLLETTALAAAEHASEEEAAALPAAAAGTASVVGAAAAHSVKAETLAACLAATVTSPAHPERAKTVSTALAAKLKTAATAQLLLADPLLANLPGQESAVSAAREKQQQWRQVELLRKQQELQQRLLVLEEQQRQRDEAAAAGFEGWNSCHWVSTTSDAPSEEEGGQISASDATACPATSGGPSGSNNSRSFSFPKELLQPERNDVGFAPSTYPAQGHHLPNPTFVEKVARGATTGAGGAETRAAAADHTTAAARGSAATAENTTAGVGIQRREREQQVSYDFGAPARAAAVTSAAATCVVSPAALPGNVDVTTYSQDESSGLSFQYLLWQEDDDFKAVGRATEEHEETSTHAHSGNSSPAKEAAGSPSQLSGGYATTAPANAATAPASNRSSSDTLQQKQIRYPFPEAAVLWESSISCCTGELSASAAFDEEHLPQLLQQQQLPLQPLSSAQQPHAQQQQDSHQEQRARLPLRLLQQQSEGQTTVGYDAILSSEWVDARQRVLNSTRLFSSSSGGRGTQSESKRADGERGAAAAVAKARVTQAACSLDPPCSSHQGRGSCTCTAGEARAADGEEEPNCLSAAAATAAEESSAAAGAAADSAGIRCSATAADSGTFSTAVVAVRSQSGRVAAARTAAAGRAVLGSDSSRLICEAAEKGAAAHQALALLRRVTKTRAAAATEEAEGKGKHLLLQPPTASTSPRKIVPLHRHWVQQLLLQQKKQQQRVQRLQLQQQRLQQQRQTQGKPLHSIQRQQQHTKRHQLRHTSQEHPTREQRHPQSRHGDRAVQQTTTSKQGEDNHQHLKKRSPSKARNIVKVAVEGAKLSIREDPSPPRPHTISSSPAPPASWADEGGLTRNYRAICARAARSALPADSVAAPAAAAPKPATPADAPAASGAVALASSGAAAAVPAGAAVSAAAAARTAARRSAAAASNDPSCRAVLPAPTAEGVPRFFDSENDLHSSRDVILASTAAADVLGSGAAADHSFRRAAAAEVQGFHAFAAVAGNPSIINAPSLARVSFREPLLPAPKAKESLSHVYASSSDAVTVALRQQNEHWPSLQDNMRLAIASPVFAPAGAAAAAPHASGGSAPIAAAAAAGAVAGGVHLRAASSACPSSATSPAAAPVHAAVQREQRARSIDPPAGKAVNSSLLHGTLSLKGSRMVLQQPRPAERRSSTCEAAAAAATSQRSGSLGKGASTAGSVKSFTAAPSAPCVAAAAPALTVSTVAQAAAPRPVFRGKGAAVSASSGGTKGGRDNMCSSSRSHCKKSGSRRHTTSKQQSNDNSSSEDQRRSREKDAPSEAAAEGDSLKKKRVGRTATALQRLRHLHANVEQPPRRILQQEQRRGRQQQQLVKDVDLVVRGRHVDLRGVLSAEEMSGEREQQQDVASSKCLCTDKAKKARSVREQEETRRGRVFDEDTTDDAELQRTLRRLRARLLLDTWETGSPATTQQRGRHAEHSSASRHHQPRNCSSSGKRQRQPSASSRRGSERGAASRLSKTSLAGMNFSHLSCSSNAVRGLAASVSKGKEAAERGRKDAHNVGTAWGVLSNSKDRKERGRRDSPIDAAATSAPAQAAGAAREPAKGKTSTADCGNRPQQLLASTTGSNTAKPKYVRQQKENREQLQQQWRPEEGEGTGRRDTKNLCRTPGANAETGGVADLRVDSSCGSVKSNNRYHSTSSCRCTSRSTHLSRSRRSNSSSTSCTPSTILRRLRRLLEKESSPSCLSPRYLWRRRRRKKGRAKRREVSSGCSSKSGNEQCKSIQRRGRRSTSNKDADSDSRSSKHRTSSSTSGSTRRSGSMSPSGTSSRRGSGGSSSERGSSSRRSSSSSCKDIAEASKRVWMTLLEDSSRRLASSSRPSSSSRHHASISSGSRYRSVSNSGSASFTDSSSEASSNNGATSSCGAHSSNFADERRGGAAAGFSRPWSHRLRQKTKKRNSSAGCLPAVDGAAATRTGAATGGICAALAADGCSGLGSEGRTAVAAGKGKEPAPSLISLWLQCSAAALEESDQQQQRQGIFIAAQGEQQLKKKVHADKLQGNLEASSSHYMPGKSSSKSRGGGKSKVRRNWRYSHDSSNSNESRSRSGCKDSAFWHSRSGRCGRTSSSSSTSESMLLSNRPSDEDIGLSPDPDAFIRRIKRRLRLPLSPRLQNRRQQQQRQQQDSSEISGSNRRCVGKDTAEKQPRRNTGRNSKHRQPQQQERQQEWLQGKRGAFEEETAGACDRETDVDREHQQREEKGSPGKFVHNQERVPQPGEDVVQAQREQEQHCSAITAGPTTGAAAAVDDDPSGPLRLSALGSPTASAAKLDVELQFHQQLEDTVVQRQQQQQQQGKHAQPEAEDFQKTAEEEEHQLGQAKQQRRQNQPWQQEQGPPEPQELKVGEVQRWNTSLCPAAAAAAEGGVVAALLDAGEAPDAIQEQHASLPSAFVSAEGGQTDVSAAVQLGKSSLDAVSRAAVAQAVKAASPAVLNEPANDVTTRNEKVLLPHADKEASRRKESDKKAAAVGASCTEKARSKQQLQLGPEQEQQSNVNMPEKEAPERPAEVLLRVEQQEAGEQHAGTLQPQQHVEMQQLYQSAQQQGQPFCGLREEQAAPTVAAEEEVSAVGKIMRASHVSEVLQLQPLLSMGAENQNHSSEQQQSPAPAEEAQRIINVHAAHARGAAAAAGVVSYTFLSPVAEESPSHDAAAAATAVNRTADAAAAPAAVAVHEGTDAVRTHVTAEHVAAASKAEDSEDTSLAAVVTAETQAAGAEAREGACDDVDVPCAPAARVASCVAVNREQQQLTAAAGSESAESPAAAAVAAARDPTNVRYASSMESFSFSLSSSSGSSSAADHTDSNPLKQSCISLDNSSSSNPTVNSSLTNKTCLCNTSSNSLDSVKSNNGRIMPETTVTAEKDLSSKGRSANAGAAAELTAGTAAGGLLTAAVAAKGEGAATDTEEIKMAGAAKVLDIKATCSNPTAAAASFSMCLLSGNLGASGTAAVEGRSSATMSTYREAARGETAQLPSARSDTAESGLHRLRRDSDNEARDSSISACVQQYPVRPQCSFDKNNYRSRQREAFAKEETRCSLHVKAKKIFPTATTDGQADVEVAAAAAAAVGASSLGHVGARRAACPDGGAAETCSADRSPLLHATSQEGQQQPRQLEEIFSEPLLTREAPPPEVLALLKQQQRQLHSSTAELRPAAKRCAHGLPSCASERENWLPLLSLATAKHGMQHEEGQQQQQQAEQLKCDQQHQKPRGQRKKKRNKRQRHQQALQEERRLAGPFSAPVAADDDSAARTDRPQAEGIREEIESFVEGVSLLLGGGRQAEGTVASGSSAARSAVAAFAADTGAALFSGSSATMHKGYITVERPSLAAPRTQVRESKLLDVAASVSVRGAAAGSLPAARSKTELLAAALAELRQLLGKREGFSGCGVTDLLLQAFNPSTSSGRMTPYDVADTQEQFHAQTRKCGAKSSNGSITSTVGAVRCKRGTATDTAEVEARERSATSDCASLRAPCDGVGAAAPQRRKAKKAAARDTCSKGSEGIAASIGKVDAEAAEPQGVIKSRYFHGARRDCRCRTASQQEGGLSTSATDQCTERYRRVEELAPAGPRSSSSRLSSRWCGGGNGRRQLSCSRPQGNRANSADTKRRNNRSNSRSCSQRRRSDRTESSDRSVRNERCAGSLNSCVHTRAAAAAARSRDRRSSSISNKRSSPSHAAYGCVSVYSVGSDQSSSRTTSSCDTRRSRCCSEYARHETEENDSVLVQQQHAAPQKASKQDGRMNRRVRRLQHQHPGWHEQQQQRQHQAQHGQHRGRQGGADRVRDRAHRSLEHLENVAYGHTGPRCTHALQQQQEQQQQEMASSCRRTGHTSFRRCVIQPSRSLSPSSPFSEQKSARAAPSAREQPPRPTSSLLHGEGQLPQGLQQLLQQREEVPSEHDLAWCWREWGGCEIYKQQRSRLQAVLREALEGPA